MIGSQRRTLLSHEGGFKSFTGRVTLARQSLSTPLFNQACRKILYPGNLTTTIKADRAPKPRRKQQHSQSWQRPVPPKDFRGLLFGRDPDLCLEMTWISRFFLFGRDPRDPDFQGFVVLQRPRPPGVCSFAETRTFGCLLFGRD